MPSSIRLVRWVAAARKAVAEEIPAPGALATQALLKPELFTVVEKLQGLFQARTADRLPVVARVRKPIRLDRKRIAAHLSCNRQNFGGRAGSSPTWAGLIRKAASARGSWHRCLLA